MRMTQGHGPFPSQRVKGQSTRRAIALFSLLGSLVATSVGAQFDQYTAPGGLGAAEVSTKESIEKSVANAPWHLGKVRFQPYIGVKDVGYVQNLLGNEGRPINDVTATLGLGLKGYLPVGPKVVVAAHFLPEYSWWQKSVDLRGWHLRSGVGAYGFFNHLTLELKATGTDLLDYVSTEFDSPATVKSTDVGLDARIDLYGPWALYVGGTYLDTAYDDKGVENVFGNQIEALDRTEKVGRLGASYTLSNGFRTTVGGQWSQTDFSDRRDRSNDGMGPFLAVSFVGTHWGASADVSRYDLQPANADSTFVPFTQTAGRARLSWSSTNRLGASVYAGRHLVYSLAVGSSYFVDQRVGLALSYTLGWRTQLQGFVEKGDNRFQSVAGSGFSRQDDYTGYGGTFQFKATETTTLLIGFARQIIDSTLPGATRTLTTLRLNLNLGSGLLSPW